MKKIHWLIILSIFIIGIIFYGINLSYSFNEHKLDIQFLSFYPAPPPASEDDVPPIPGVVVRVYRLPVYLNVFPEWYVHSIYKYEKIPDFDSDIESFERHHNFKPEVTAISNNEGLVNINLTGGYYYLTTGFTMSDLQKVVKLNQDKKISHIFGP